MTELLIDDRILSIKGTADWLDLSVPTLYRMMQSGDFVQPIRVGARRSGFLKSEVVAWVASRQRGLRPAVCGKSAAA